MGFFRHRRDVGVGVGQCEEVLKAGGLGKIHGGVGEQSVSYLNEIPKGIASVEKSDTLLV